MKKGKLLIALALCLALICGLSITAFAAARVPAPAGLRDDQVFFFDKYGSYYIVDKDTVVSKGDVWGYVVCIQDLIVRLYQETLNPPYDIAVDGDFGNATYRAVLTFQGNNNLTMDGDVGPYTWDAFQEAWQTEINNKILPHVEQ